MIRVKRNDTEWEIVTPTIFPDNSSQVWKLKTELNFTPNWDNQNRPTFTIKWNFESESEFMHLAQLRELLGPSNKVYLEVPYFPYARQDKEVDNANTFAKHAFCGVLANLIFEKVTTYDIHSDAGMFASWQNTLPTHIHKAVEASNPDLIFYPDKGAFTRYSNMFTDQPYKLNLLPKGYGEKVRNQATGAITSYNVVLPSDYPGDTVLIVDDLIDGGATFIEAAKQLKKEGAKYVELCVSHAVSTKGLQNVLDNGISRVYTTNSRNITFPNKVTVFEV